MFRLTKDEYENLARSKIFTSRIWTMGNKGGRTSLPYVFKEQGIYRLANKSIYIIDAWFLRSKCYRWFVRNKVTRMKIVTFHTIKTTSINLFFSFINLNSYNKYVKI